MSVQAEQVIPKSLQISANKPPAVQSYLRRFFAIQTPSQAKNLANAEIIIPIDCTTASCFLDPHQSYLTFNLEFFNTNPYIDYANFGPAGAASVIEKLQVKSQGTVIEEIQDYATMFELALNREGANMEEFSMYVSRYNGLKSGWQWGDSNNINLIKPPMVDRAGLIMYACTPDNFGKPHGWQAPHIVPYYAGTNGTQTTSIAMPVASTSSTYERGWYCADGHNYYYHMDGINPNTWPDTLGREIPLYISESQINARATKRLQDYFTFLSNVKCIPIGCKSTISRDPNTGIYTPSGGSLGQQTASGTYENSSSYTIGHYSHQVTLPIMSGILGLQAEKSFPTCICQDLSLVLTLSTAMKASYFTMDPCRRIVGTRRDYVVWKGQVLGGIWPNGTYGTALVGRVKIPDLSYGGDGGTSTIPQSNAFSDAVYTNGTTNYVNVMAQFGLLSQWAQCSNYLNGLAGCVTAYQEQSGTYSTPISYPYTGAYGQSDPSSATTTGTNAWYVQGNLGTEFRQRNASWSNWPGQGCDQGVPVFSQADVQYNSEYPAFPYGGYYNISSNLFNNNYTNFPQDPVMRMQAIVNSRSMESGSSSQSQTQQTGTIDFQSSCMPSWSSFCYQGKMPQYFIPSTQQYFGTATQALTTGGAAIAPVETPDTTPSAVYTAAVSAGSTALCVANYGLAYTANMLPVMQYQYFNGGVPMSAAHYLGTPNIGNDGMGCFGTWLSASQPQTKRCFYNYNQPSTSALTDVNNTNITYLKYFGQGNNNCTSGQGAYPTFIISNVSFVCQQILLPDVVAAQIVSLSAQGNIAIQTRSMRVFTNLTNATKSTNQNIIVPVRVGLANSLIFIFRSNDQMQLNDKQGMLHSLSGFNPFGSITYTPDTQSYSGTNTAPSVVPMTTTPTIQVPNSSAWSAQLQIGADYVPPQAITTPAELIYEVEKETHDLFNLRSRPLAGVVHNLAQSPSITTYSTQFYNQLGTTYSTYMASGSIAVSAENGSGPGNGAPGALGSGANTAIVAWYGPGADSTHYYGAQTNYSLPSSAFSYTVPSVTDPDPSTTIDITTTDTFWTVYQDPDYLLDQTLINNSNMRHLTNYQNVPEPTLDKWVPVQLGQYHINSFVSPKGKFYLPFELESFSGISNVASSGRYLGNNQVSLILQGAAMFAALSLVNVTAVVLAQATISIEAGGTVRMFM